MWIWQACSMRVLFIGVVVGLLPLSSHADHHLFDNNVMYDKIQSDVFDDIIKSIAKRIPGLKECFTPEIFRNATSSTEQSVTYEEASQMLLTFILEQKCDDGKLIESRTPLHYEDLDYADITWTLTELGYKGCHEVTSCFNAFTLHDKLAGSLEIIRYIYQGQCILPDEDYFKSKYLKRFEDSSGVATRSGFKAFMKQLGIGQQSGDKSEGSHPGHDEDGKDRETSEDNNKKPKDGEKAENGRKVDDDDASGKTSHVHEEGEEHNNENENNEDNLKDGIQHGDDSDKAQSSDRKEGDDLASDHDTKDQRAPHGDTSKAEYDEEQIGGVKTTTTSADIEENEAEKEMNANEESEMPNVNHGGADIVDEKSGKDNDGDGQETTNGINSQDEPADIATSEKFNNEIGNSDGSTPDKNGDELSNQANVRNKRSSHLPKESRCYTSDQLLDIFEIDDTISDEKAMEMCPALIQQLKSDACKSSHNYDHHNPPVKKKSGYTQAMAYGYGTVSVAIISLLALLGLALFPILESTTYKIIMQFFIGLAVGTLSSDALIHIIPQVLGVHRHDSHDDHMGEEHEEDRIFIWQMSVVFGGLYIVAGFESFLRAIKKSRSLKKNKRQRSSYHETPGIDNIPNESGPENAVTSFSCDVVSRDSVTQKDQKLSVTESEQMLLRHDIICCNLTPTLITVFIGDVLHNFADGLAIGVAFAFHWSTGISTSIAILCHELPHEIGDFAIYLRNGASKWKAIGLNFTAACFNFIGLYVGINMASDEIVRRWLLCAIAGIFIYISLVQVMSTMLKDVCERPILQFFIQNIGMLLGWAIMLLIALYEDRIRIGT